MTTHEPSTGPDGIHWADRHIGGIPHGRDVTIPITVNADDHPSAVLTARLAPLAVDTWRHIDELPSLGKDRLYYLLNDVRKLAAAVETLEEDLILKYRDAGASWAELGAALDVHRQTARDRYHAIVRANDRGLNLRGAEDADIERRIPDVGGYTNISVGHRNAVGDALVTYTTDVMGQTVTISVSQAPERVQQAIRLAATDQDGDES